MIRRGAAALALLVAGVAAGSEVELRHGEDVLDHGLPRWRDSALRVALARPAGPGLEVVASRLERFGHVDRGLAAAAHAPVGGRWDLRLEASGSPTHDVVPAWTAGASAHCRLGRGVAAHGGLRWSRYEADPVSTGVALGHAGLEYYRGPFRLAWTTYAARLEGSWSASGAAAWEVFYRARDRASLVVSAGRELESLGGGRVLASDVLGLVASGRTALDEAWSISWGVELVRQGELYSRAGGRLGLVREF